MRIEVDDLERGGKEFAHAYAPGELTLEDEQLRFAEDVELKGSASRKGTEVRLRGGVKTRVEALCDRCHRAVNLPVNAEFDLKYVPAQAEDSSAAELQAEDLAASVYEGACIDVDELAREQVLLNVPMRVLCKEDCKGLCPQCGADLNEETCACKQADIDPRWAALAALKQDQG